MQVYCSMRYGTRICQQSKMCTGTMECLLMWDVWVARQDCSLDLWGSCAFFTVWLSAICPRSYILLGAVTDMCSCVGMVWHSSLARISMVLITAIWDTGTERRCGKTGLHHTTAGECFCIKKSNASNVLCKCIQACLCGVLMWAE